MPKLTIHFRPLSWCLGWIWNPKSRNLYLSLLFVVLRVHFPRAIPAWRSGLYVVSEAGCVTHVVRAYDKDEAVKFVFQHLTELQMTDHESIEDFWVERLIEPDEPYTIHLDSVGPLTLTGGQWSEVYSAMGSNVYIACSEW